MRSFQSLRDLLCDAERFLHRQWSGGSDSLSECLAWDHFQNKEVHIAGLLKFVNATDIVVIERCQELCFAAEAGETLGILCKCFRQNFQSDFSPQVGVLRSVNFSHPALTKERENLIGAEISTDQ